MLKQERRPGFPELPQIPMIEANLVLSPITDVTHLVKVFVASATLAADLARRHPL